MPPSRGPPNFHIYEKGVSQPPTHWCRRQCDLEQSNIGDAPEKQTNASNEVADFLLTDLETAFTVLEVAAVSAIEETKKRNHKKAHRAYQTVLRLLNTVRPEAPQRPAINQRLALLKERLEKKRGTGLSLRLAASSCPCRHLSGGTDTDYLQSPFLLSTMYFPILEFHNR